MTDTAKIIANAQKISELVVSQSEALTAYVTAAHATADAILLLAGEIEEEAGGDAPGLPELNIRDAQSVQAGEVARFGVIVSGTIEHEAAQVRWAASNGETGTVPLSAGDHAVIIDVRTSVAAGAGTLTVALSDPVGCTIGDGTGICMIMPVNGNGGGPPAGDGLEPINAAALRSDIVVGDKPRQIVEVGYGWGAGSTDHATASMPLIRQHATKMFRDLGCHVVRIHNPLTKTFSEYKAITDIAAANGVKFFLCTSYMYAANSNPQALADGVTRALAAGVRITHLSPQNEPDGNDRNAVKGNYVEHMQELSERLPPSVKLIELEWRHPENGHATFDKLKAAGLAGRGVHAGALHIYNKASSPALYDQRWATVGAGLWSAETGDMSNPKAPAQFVAGLLYGVVAEIAHIGISIGGKNDDMRQKLFDPNGNPQDYALACGIISRALLPGTVMRGCASSDRPAGMGSEQAMRMLWAATPRQPRHFVAVGKRPDGKWFLAAVNFAFGADSPSQWAGGHYAAATQQLTVRVPGLGNDEFIGRICEGNGKVGPERRWSAVDDHTRFTLAPGATVAMVSAS